VKRQLSADLEQKTQFRFPHRESQTVTARAELVSSDK
jgi:hypothetical protein